MATARPLEARRAATFSPAGQTILGLVLWGGLALLAPPGWLPMLFLWAPLVLFPSGLALFERQEREATSLTGFAPLAIVALAGSFLLEQGSWAGLLTFPWFCFALGTAFLHTHRALSERDYSGAVVAGYWLVGAGWLGLARLGVRPLGFSHEIVLATAVHFHYAGFLLPVLLMQQRREGPGLMLAVLLGVPLVALGITLSAFEIGVGELLATWFLAGVSLIVAWTQGRAALRFGAWLARAAALGSSACLALAMLLAVLYAINAALGIAWLDLPLMLRTHGCLQAFGFAPLGLIAWTLVSTSPSEIRP